MYEPRHNAPDGLPALRSDRLIALFGADRAAIAEILEMALDALKTLVGRIQAELSSAHFNDAHALAHEMKGVCANIGAEELANLAADIQTRLAAPRGEGLETLASSLPLAYDRFAREAKAFLS